MRRTIIVTTLFLLSLAVLQSRIVKAEDVGVITYYGVGDSSIPNFRNYTQSTDTWSNEYTDAAIDIDQQMQAVKIIADPDTASKEKVACWVDNAGDMECAVWDPDKWSGWDRNLEVARKQNPEKSSDEIERITLEFTASRENSMHATGGAVDALIYDPENDCVLDFGTNNGFKIDLNRKCYPLHPGISSEAKKNRKLLMDLFENEDFVCDLTEYWHFDYGNVVWALEKGRASSRYGVVMDRR